MFQNEIAVDLLVKEGYDVSDVELIPDMDVYRQISEHPFLSEPSLSCIEEQEILDAYIILFSSGYASVVPDLFRWTFLDIVSRSDFATKYALLAMRLQFFYMCAEC